MNIRGKYYEYYTLCSPVLIVVSGRFLRGIFSTNIWAVWVQKSCRKYSSKILFGKYGKRLRPLFMGAESCEKSESFVATVTVT